MTYLDKYKKEHPGLSDEDYQSTVQWTCPRDSHGRKVSCTCKKLVFGTSEEVRDICGMCWNQEIPGTEPTNKKFTKADLKVGYVVKYRNGSLRMVMPYTGGLVLTTLNGGDARCQYCAQ
jgi:hypothetical protein